MLISIDGNKATGKSSLLATVKDFLPSVAVVCEKEHDPYREETIKFIKSLGPSPKPEQDLILLRRFAQGRAHVSHYVKTLKSDIIFLDRWYLSDLAFRPTASLQQVLGINRELAVLEPDLRCVICCEPESSWRRAAERPKGLSSNVIHNLAQMTAVHQRFLWVAEQAGAQVFDTSGQQSDCLQRFREWILALIEGFGKVGSSK